MINIYKNQKGKPTFNPGGTLLARVECDRPHELDAVADLLIVPSVRNGYDPIAAEFRASTVLMSARNGLFGMRIVSTTIDDEEPARKEPRKR